MAKYVFGNRWRTALKITNEDDDSSVSEDGEGQTQPATLPLKDYLSHLDEIGDPLESDEVLFLHSLIDDDKTLDANLAAATFNRFETVEKLTLKRLLTDRIEDNKRGQCSNASVIKFFTLPNAAREYFFFKSAVLKEFLKEKNLKPNGNKIDDMIQVLSGAKETDTTAPVLSGDKAAIKAVLDRSFQKPQKGMLREHCSSGHRLETPILNSWIELARTDRYFPIPNLSVTSAYTAGLAGKKGMPEAKDSIDFHLHVKTCPDEVGDRQMWGFEAKGRVTPAAAFAEEDALISMARDEHIHIPDTEVSENLAVSKERWQILHHAFVYDYPTVVHAVGDSHSEIIQSTIVDFSEETKHHYEKVIRDMKDLTLEWAYSCERSPVPIPDNVKEAAEQVKTINGFDCLQGTVNLWKEMSMSPLPLPPLHRILPAMHAHWNQTKSGSDTTTMLMDGCLAQIPHVSPESVATNRYIGLMCVLVHRLNQVISARPGLEYPSLAHYCNVASHRSTFHCSILQCRQIFLDQLEKLQTSTATSTSVTHHKSPTVSPVPAVCVPCAPLRDKTNNAVREFLNDETFKVPAPLPFQTPHKLPKKIREGSAPAELISLNKKCTEQPVKRWNGNQMRCEFPGCSGQTSWYCIGCKQWFCMEKKKNSR